jgi:O-acetyl-ADP-ribose deacetylase (regulator of RNase III)
VGEVVLTQGYQLPARQVIHTVGPRWRDGRSGEPDRLRSCYGRSIALAESIQARSIAFPGISTGVFRFPKDLATLIAVETVLGSLSEPTSITEIIFCCYSQEDLARYLEALDQTL